MNYIASVEGRDLEISIDRDALTVDGAARAVDLRSIDGANLYSLLLDNESHEVFVERREGVYTIMIEGNLFAVEVEDERLKRLKAMGGQLHDEAHAATITAPMPGLVVKVLVEAGQEVAEDQGVVILEAMKMENEIRSPSRGVVRSVSVTAGQTIMQGDTMLVIGDAP